MNEQAAQHVNRVDESRHSADRCEPYQARHWAWVHSPTRKNTADSMK